MNLISEQFPEPDVPNRSRYRRRKKFFPSLTDTSRSELLENLANRVSPNFDFFLFALLSGVVVGLAFLFNSHALLIVAALLAPIMAPVIGISLASATGNTRFLFLSIAGTFVGCLLVCIAGGIAGAASSILPAKSLAQPVNFSSVTWDVLIVLILGIFLMALSLLKSELKPVLPSAAIAYVLFSTAGGIGFDLGQRNFQAAMDGGLTLGIYILIGAIIGSIIFLAYGFRPLSQAGYILPLVLALLLAFPVILTKPFNSGKFMAGLNQLPKTTGTAVPSSSPTNSIPQPESAFTQTPQPSKTSTPKPTSSSTPSPSITPTSTLLNGVLREWVLIDADGQAGARLREKPGFASKLITIIDNGVEVILLPGVEFKDNVYWAHVETIDGTIGWMVHTVLSTSTPTITTTPTQE